MGILKWGRNNRNNSPPAHALIPIFRTRVSRVITYVIARNKICENKVAPAKAKSGGISTISPFQNSPRLTFSHMITDLSKLYFNAWAVVLAHLRTYNIIFTIIRSSLSYLYDFMILYLIYTY